MPEPAEDGDTRPNAVRATIAFGFERCGLSRIVATVYPANTASARVLEKVGMGDEGRRANDDDSFTDLYAFERAAPA